MSLEQIIGGCIAVITAGMPAVIALLKIDKLYVSVNSRMDKFIAATLHESESRLAALSQSRDLLVKQNEQLIEQLGEIAKRIEKLHEPGKPPCAK